MQNGLLTNIMRNVGNNDNNHVYYDSVHSYVNVSLVDNDIYPSIYCSAVKYHNDVSTCAEVAVSERRRAARKAAHTQLEIKEGSGNHMHEESLPKGKGAQESKDPDVRKRSRCESACKVNIVSDRTGPCVKGFSRSRF